MAMNPAAVGHQGYIVVGSAGNVLPFTSENIVADQAIYPADSIHGGGNVVTDGRYAMPVNFAVGQTSYNGDINGVVFGGNTLFGAAFKDLLERAIGANPTDISKRAIGFTEGDALVIGKGGYTYTYPGTGRACVTRMTINGNMGGNLTFTASVLSSDRTVTTSVTGYPTPGNDFLYETPQTTGSEDSSDDDNNPVPYWASEFTIRAGTGSQQLGETDVNVRIVDWSITFESQNPVAIFTFDGNKTAVDVLLGRLTVRGNFRYYHPNGTWSVVLNNGAQLRFRIGSYYVHVPFLAFHTYDTPNEGPDRPMERTVNFQGFSDATYPAVHINSSALW